LSIWFGLRLGLATTSRAGKTPASDTGACWHKRSSTSCEPHPSEWLAGSIDRAFLLRHARSFFTLGGADAPVRARPPGRALFPSSTSTFYSPSLPHPPLQLGPRLKRTRIDPHPPRRLDVRGDVVRIEALPGAASGALHRRLKNLRPRLHGVNFVGQHQVVEVAQQVTVGFPDHLEVRGVGFRNRPQPVPPPQPLQQALGYEDVGKDTAPDPAELVVVHLQIQNPAHLVHKLTRLHQPGFKPLHQPGTRQPPRNLFRRVRAKPLQRPIPAPEIEVNQYPAQIKQNRLMHATQSQFPVRSTTIYSPPPCEAHLRPPYPGAFPRRSSRP